jgi:hypothetical protein
MDGAKWQFKMIFQSYNNRKYSISIIKMDGAKWQFKIILFIVELKPVNLQSFILLRFHRILLKTHRNEVTNQKPSISLSKKPG